MPFDRSFYPIQARFVGSLTRMLDASLVFVFLYALAWFYKVPWSPYYTIAGLSALVFFVVFAEVAGLYRAKAAQHFHATLGRTCWAWFLVLSGLLFIAFATKSSAVFSRRVFLTWMVVTPMLLLLYRLCMAILVARFGHSNGKRLAIGGAGEVGQRLAVQIAKIRSINGNLVGFYDDNKACGASANGGLGLAVMGTLDDMVRKAHAGEIDMIFLALPMSATERIKTVVDELMDSTCRVVIVPDFFMFDLLVSNWSMFGAMPMVSVNDPSQGILAPVKWIEDKLLASFILIFIAVPLMLIAVLVKLTSRGPILFRQHRYGLDGRRIVIWKFRTMRVCEDGPDVKQVQRNDTRVTAIGRFLRRTSLDELPQFINVLQGRMSIVGPRPHAVAHNEEYRKKIRGYMLRHKVRPGITGWAQINGWRGETDTVYKMQRRVDFDLEYIKRWSLWFDIKIIVLTIVRGFGGHEVY